jgi:hypothetical protein
MCQLVWGDWVLRAARSVADMRALSTAVRHAEVRAEMEGQAVHHNRSAHLS